MLSVITGSIRYLSKFFGCSRQSNKNHILHSALVVSSGILPILSSIVSIYILNNSDDENEDILFQYGNSRFDSKLLTSCLVVALSNSLRLSIDRYLVKSLATCISNENVTLYLSTPSRGEIIKDNNFLNKKNALLSEVTGQKALSFTNDALTLLIKQPISFFTLGLHIHYVTMNSKNPIGFLSYFTTLTISAGLVAFHLAEPLKKYMELENNFTRTYQARMVTAVRNIEGLKLTTANLKEIEYLDLSLKAFSLERALYVPTITLSLFSLYIAESLILSMDNLIGLGGDKKLIANSLYILSNSFLSILNNLMFSTASLEITLSKFEKFAKLIEKATQDYDDEGVVVEYRSSSDHRLIMEDLNIIIPTEPPRIILKHANLILFPGVYKLCGISGVGKTTILKSIVGGYVHSSGNITLSAKSDKDIVFIPQNYFIPFKIKLIETLFYPNQYVEQVSKRTIEGLLNEVGLHNMISQLDIEKVWCDILSGGQKQKIMILNAYLSNPSVLLMDEPTSAMDMDSRKQTIALIKRMLTDEKIVIFTSHEPLVTENGNTFHTGEISISIEHNLQVEILGDY